MHRMGEHDYLTTYGAEILVARIKTYWNMRNKFPDVWIEKHQAVIAPSEEDGRIVCVIRSDMVNGRPVSR